jgi:putative modified peptide
MADQTITKPQLLNLLGKLATDDGFRARFEANPSSALQEAGISAQQIQGLPSDHTQPVQLADKATFEAARQRLAADNSAELLCMIVPTLRLNND